MTLPIQLSRFSVALTAGVLCASCDSAATITAPSAVPQVLATVVAAEPVSESPPAAAPTPPAAVPVLNTTPIGYGDCDFSQPGSIRCYNKSDISQTLTAAMKDLQPDGAECRVTYGTPHTVTIAPRSNGYFTLPMPPCGEKGQVDMFAGSREGDCRMAAFTGQRAYDGGACPIQPPPACTPGAWCPGLPGSPYPPCVPGTNCR